MIFHIQVKNVESFCNGLIQSCLGTYSNGIFLREACSFAATFKMMSRLMQKESQVMSMQVAAGVSSKK